ncbi:hypothetical protein ACFSX9_10095 [Flavobacterium ardleyense]|uniref:Uncharacterized protein n=1 Tax=Flavobacterium ardleyense TaxID=2038737 RepID=A0ABW5Z885_9FLAO
MKNIKILLTFATILISNSSFFAQNKFNLNFDKFTTEEQMMPDGWFKWGNYKNVIGEKIDGTNYAGKVISDKDGNFGCITYQIPANYVGDTITLSGRIKYENIKEYVGLLMRIDGGVHMKQALAFATMSTLKIRGTSDWKEYSIKLAYPANAEYIYVGGIVGRNGTAWFDDFKIKIDGVNIENIKEIPKIYLEDFDTEKLTVALRQSSNAINFSTDNDLASSLSPLIEELSNKRIVSIGESTHGTSEFYRLRAIITKKLIEEKGFNMIILENP